MTERHKTDFTKEVKFYVNKDYYAKDYDNKCCCVSSPCYDLNEAINLYAESVKDFCIDDKTRAARCEVVKVTKSGFKRIASNY